MFALSGGENIYQRVVDEEEWCGCFYELAVGNFHYLLVFTVKYNLIAIA